MSQNKKILAFISSLLVLAGCSTEIKADPKYDENGHLVSGVLEDGKTEDLTNNLRTAVWDALKENGTISSTVIDQTIYTLAEMELGAYDSLDAETKALVDERVDDKLFDAISTGEYEYRGLFNEKTFVNSIKRSLPYTIDCRNGYTEGYLIRDNSRDHLYAGGSYADGTAYTKDSEAPNAGKYALTCNYQTYKEQTYLPEVYREMLIEKYLVENEYDTLGRSYARKIQYVGIAENSKHPGAASDLVNSWIDIYLDEDSQLEADLDVLAQAWIGIDVDDSTEFGQQVGDLQEAAGLVGADHNYSLYGDILSDYAKIKDDPLLTDTSVESSFTNNGSYSKEVGLEIKTNELRTRTLGDDGWFVKNTDLTTLPNALTNRLFDISTANGMNSNLNGVATPSVVNNSKFVKMINGNYYLKPATFEPGSEDKNYDIVFYDDDSSTYYIVLIEEAVNPTKLKKLDESASDTEKARVYTEEMREEAVYEIAKSFAKRDTNKNKAMVHYLKEAGIIFHDQTIYDYFLTNYPDMFEED